MKRYILIGFVIFILLGVTGCFRKNEFTVGEESQVTLTNGLVDFYLKYGTLRDSEGTFVLKNNSGLDIEYGDVYELEILEDNKWHEINVVINFNLIAYELNNNNEVELKVNWEEAYGRLAKGKYRIVKEIYVNNNEDGYDSYFIATEFDIK